MTESKTGGRFDRDRFIWSWSNNGFTSTDEKKPKTVAVSEDYLAFLHDELAENQVRLREILGESQAQAVLSFSADRLVSTVGVGRNAADPIHSVAQKLESWGMEVTRKDKGEITDLEIRCPYAEAVHLRFSSKEPKCPLGEFILGAVRFVESKSTLLRNDLAKDGAHFRFQRSK